MTELTKEFFIEQVSKLVTKVDLGELKTDIYALQVDVSTLKMDMVEVKQKLERLDKRDKEDSNAFARDILKLQKDVKLLKLRHAI